MNSKISGLLHEYFPPAIYRWIRITYRAIRRRGPIVEDEFDYDYYTHFYAWSLDQFSKRTENNEWIVDVGGKKLANTILAHFYNLIEITPTDLNFKDSRRISINDEDFASSEGVINRVAKIVGDQKVSVILSPATFHLLDVPRYAGVSKVDLEEDHKKKKFLEFCNGVLERKGEIYIAVPITTNKSNLNSQGNIFNVDDLSELLMKHGFTISKVDFVTHGANEIETVLQNKTLYSIHDLDDIKFKSTNSYVIGYIKIERV
jgi:hypothetical protein